MPWTSAKGGNPRSPPEVWGNVCGAHAAIIARPPAGPQDLSPHQLLGGRIQSDAVEAPTSVPHVRHIHRRREVVGGDCGKAAHPPTPATHPGLVPLSSRLPLSRVRGSSSYQMLGRNEGSCFFEVAPSVPHGGHIHHRREVVGGVEEPGGQGGGGGAGKCVKCDDFGVGAQRLQVGCQEPQLRGRFRPRGCGVKYEQRMLLCGRVGQEGGGRGSPQYAI